MTVVVVVVTDCPPRLRGDLTKWLLEINTGVYVGNLNARVRDRLWDRVCEYLKNGRATMVYRSSGEQHLDFRVHNTTWEPVDYDGIKLIRRPVTGQKTEGPSEQPQTGFSKAAKRQMARRMSARRNAPLPSDYCVLDLETTGLDCETDDIIEIGALRVRADSVTAEFQTLVTTEKTIPGPVRQLTGLTEEDLTRDGIPLRDAMERLMEFIGTDCMVCHNAPFDQSFLLTALRELNLSPWKMRFQDTMLLARKHVKGLADYRLATVAEHFGINAVEQHRALPDCYLAFGILMELKEI